jgi:phosphopantetheinyl transferase (holo-ACP synthase)
MAIGNDVVDLTAPRAVATPANPRFVERVFTETERERINRATRPDLEVWLGWAAKESAYKVVSKFRTEPPVFVHRAFEVRWDDGAPARSRLGAVLYDGHTFPVQGAVDPEERFVHVFGAGPDMGHSAGREPIPTEGPHFPSGVRWTVDRIDRPNAPWLGSLEELSKRLTERERDAVHSVLSAAVRIGAKEEASKLLSLAPDRIEIVCRPGRFGRRPPSVLVDGRPAKIDVSLSHDGPWIAWAFSPIDPPGDDLPHIPERRHDDE